jgi:hypothetical protein
MGKVTRLELWWQLYRTSLPVRDLENFRPMDFCWTECTFDGWCCVSERIVLKGLPRRATTLILTSLDSDHFNTSGKTPYIQTTDFLATETLPYIRTTSLYQDYFPVQYTANFTTCGPLQYFRNTSVHPDHFSMHPDHFPTSGSLHYIRSRSLPHIQIIPQHPTNLFPLSSFTVQ